jgi:enterochelin esterase-like enzyme
LQPRRVPRTSRWRPAAALTASAALTAALLASLPTSAQADDKGAISAAITFDSKVAGSKLQGRAYFLVRPGDQDPLSSIAVDGDTAIFGDDVDQVSGGDTVALKGGSADGVEGVYGFPYASLDDLPSGTYTVRAFFNVYETVTRSDGSTVTVHFPCGDGGNPWRSPGNLQSAMQTVTIDRSKDTTIALDLDTKLAPAQAVPAGGTCQQGNTPDTTHVKHVKLRSDKLSRFWGRDMYVAADVVLPQDYFDAANAQKRYPVVYNQGHYSTRNPFGYSETDTTSSFNAWWKDPASPKMIAVQFRTENPFYDDSYVVNSANLGPYGDAVNDELIPALDAQFRTIAQPYARALTGGSTGGWIGVANQIFRPDVFGGSWSGYPDSLDFNAHQTVDLYGAKNAYTEEDGSTIPSSHNYDIPSGTDTVEVTMPDENHYELAIGNRSRSMGQWDIWNAVFGAQGANCYPLEPWNKVDGTIDHASTNLWKPFDMSEYLTANWSKLSPTLRGKMRIWVGTEDTYYLNEGVKAFEETVNKLSGTTDFATFTYGKGAPHGYTPYASTADMLTEIAAAFEANTPAPGTAAPDLSHLRGNLWSDVSSTSCATAASTAPVVSGDLGIGSTLTSQPGTWDSAMTFSYQWLRDGTPIEGATASSYRLVEADRGAAISLAVTGRKPGYTAQTRSSNSVTAGALATTPEPTIAGTPAVGRTIAARAGTWDKGTRFTYQWLRGGSPIRGATSRTYRLTPADVRAKVSVTVTGNKTGYTSVSRRSASITVAPGRLAKHPKPSVRGVAKVGKRLVARPGRWDSGVKLSYRWKRDGKAIGGATAATYRVKAKDKGSRISVTVTGRKAGYASSVRTSRHTSKVRR